MQQCLDKSAHVGLITWDCTCLNAPQKLHYVCKHLASISGKDFSGPRTVIDLSGSLERASIGYRTGPGLLSWLWIYAAWTGLVESDSFVRFALKFVWYF
jgi:hypothetical protein